MKRIITPLKRNEKTATDLSGIRTLRVLLNLKKTILEKLH